MNTLIFMVSIALLLSITFVIGYIWALSTGQFDDLSTPAMRILIDEALFNKKGERKTDEK